MRIWFIISFLLFLPHFPEFHVMSSSMNSRIMHYLPLEKKSNTYNSVAENETHKLQ